MKQRRIRCLAAAAFVLLFLGAAWFTGCDLSLIWSRRDHLTDIAAKMFPPDWGFLGKVLPLLWATIQMSITGTFLGAVLSIPAAMACAASLPGPGPVKKAVRFCIQVLRSFPALILALLATFFLGIGSFAGTAAITVYTFAIMTRLTYEDIESAPQGPYLALRAMGAASAQAFFRSTLPEILPAYLTNALYLLEGNVRHSAILGYVGAGGIGLLLEKLIGGIDQCQRVLVELQVDNPALIVNRASGAILHRLGHIVNVDIVAKYLTGAAVLGRDGGAGKPDVCSVGQAVPDDAGCADGSLDLQFALFILLGDHLFGEAVLTTVSLVSHNNDVPPLRQRLFSAFKLKHGSKNNSIRRPAIQQGF